ncbi:hypothetical protein OH773_22085 (plasmid) [Buttiauxella sp. WJP83]|uniref:hypothetical protein n=1 Tax=Buttiauxella sp. WJP83 TaxID=2986951 RepID=UPI0022DDF494|nr:hypothetical protein [Buttiauxella sp. WJP83]WBM72935.1 hypothetical protein OH773_22085 [Buttiauxella sp. WJP83]
MNRGLWLLIFMFIGRPVLGVQPVDFTKETVGVINNKIIEVNDSLQRIVRNLSFSINTSEPMPTASSGWVNGVPTIMFSSSMLDVAFYSSELSTLVYMDRKWMDCNVVYSSYINNAYKEMMSKKNENLPITPLIPPEKYGGVCAGIESYYPFTGDKKVLRDLSAKNAIGFMYLHELSHLYLNHTNYHNDSLSNEERREANCAMRRQEKEADLLAARKLVKFGWYNSALDVSVWRVMANLGVIETSRNSTLDHPTALERMTYVLDDVRGAILESGGQISDEMSEAIDESKALEEKANRTMSEHDSEDAGTGECSA